MKPKKKICLVCPQLSNFTNNHSYYFLGGAEMIILILTREFAKRGYGTSLIVFGTKKTEYKFENFTVFESDMEGGKIPFFRFFYKLTYNFMKSLAKVNADVYIEMGASALTGLIARFCKKNNKKFIFWAANTHNTDGSFIKRTNFRDAKLYQYGLKNASILAVQTAQQQEQLKQNHNLSSIIIGNPSVWETGIDLDKERKYFLWVANIVPKKQPEVLVSIAKKLPHIKFVVCGAPRDPSYFEKIENDFNKVPNIHYAGFLRREEIPKYYENGIALLNTSTHEGFSLAWMEAWAYCMPIISLNVNPDNILTEKKVGFHSGSEDQMVKDIDRVYQNKKLRQEIGENGKNYLQENHSISKIMDKFAEVINGFEFDS